VERGEEKMLRAHGVTDRWIKKQKKQEPALKFQSRNTLDKPKTTANTYVRTPRCCVLKKEEDFRVFNTHLSFILHPSAPPIMSYGSPITAISHRFPLSCPQNTLKAFSL